MSDENAPPAPGMDRAPAFAWFSMLSGALSALLIVATLQPTPKTAAGQLAYFAGHQGMVALGAFTVLAWAVLSIPLVVALGQILAPKSPSFAKAATVLTAEGKQPSGTASHGGFTAETSNIKYAELAAPPKQKFVQKFRAM